MAVVITDTIAAKVGSAVYAVAVGQSAVALASKAVAVDAPVSMTWTNGNATVSTGTADGGKIGRAIYNADTFEVYVIVDALAGISYTIDRLYVGTAGANAFDSVIFTPAVSGVAGQAGRVWSGVP